MFTARTIDNRKIEPEYKAICFCENCGHRVLPKCVTPGSIYLKRKHFFHNKGVCCDDWYEPMSEWHYEWQSHVPITQREVSIDNGYDRHIADIFLDIPNIVIELQKSNIPINIKSKRDIFYNRIFWIVHDSLKTMSWVTSSEKPIFVDLLDGNIKTPFGDIIPKERFISNILLNPNLKYEDWVFGIEGDVIRTRYGKKSKDEIIQGEHLIFLKENGFVSQCLLCDNHNPQHCDMSEIIHINKNPHFQCNFCGRIYCAYPVKDDPRGDDEVRDSKLAFKQTNPFFGKNIIRIWDLHKKQKQANKVI